MELDKQLTVPAPPERVWALLLDPQVMGACVPGLQAIEVLSDTEYLAQMQVKLAFIQARFKIRTTVVEQRPPHYLRSEGVGEDAAVASSFKQVSEMTLVATEAGHTALRMTVRVDLLGRLGSFGLAVMKTKADRLWDEFGLNLIARAQAGERPAESVAEAADPAALEAAAQAPAQAGPALASPLPVPVPLPKPVPWQAEGPTPRRSWWQRLSGRADPQDFIQVIVDRNNTRVEVRWPLHGAQACQSWLRELLGGDAASAQRHP